MIEKPYAGKAKVNFDGMKLLIDIPTKKNWFAISFLLVWMAGWFMGESSAINEILSSDKIGTNSFLIIWVTGWSVGGLFAISVLFWSLFGQETIAIERGVFSVSKGILDIRFYKKEYDLNSIKNLELNTEPTGMNSSFGQKLKANDLWGITGGKLRFDYGMKTIKLGIGIDEAEARYLIEEIKRHGFYKENE